MPIYTFVCRVCEHQFDKISRSGAQTEVCPQCGQEANRGVEVPSPFQWGRGGRP